MVEDIPKIGIYGVINQYVLSKRVGKHCDSSCITAPP